MWCDNLPRLWGKFPHSTVILKEYLENIPLKSCNIAKIFIKLINTYKVRKVSKILQEPCNVRSKHYKWNFAAILIFYFNEYNKNNEIEYKFEYKLGGFNTWELIPDITDYKLKFMTQKSKNLDEIQHTEIFAVVKFSSGKITVFLRQFYVILFDSI